ncbi:MAG: L-lactate permease [Solirubrobacteraceae bacterium]
MYKQVFDPVDSSLGLSAIFAVMPLVVLFVLLGGFKVKAHWAALAALGTALVVGIAVYGMPAGQAFDSGAEGATFGLFPIRWIVFNALWIYNMTVETGRFDVLRRSMGAVSTDARIQAVLIAFCFGTLLEGLAGFGTPVAITAVMLIALGFNPIKAAAVALIADTAPVAFGAIAIPITTLGQTTGLDPGKLGAMVGRQTPFLALLVPLVIVFVIDGLRGLRQTWMPALLAGFAFGVTQFAVSNYVSIQLADIIAALVSIGSVVAVTRIWHPSEPLTADVGGRGAPAIAGAATRDTELEERVEARDGHRPDTLHDALDERRKTDSAGAILEAFAPYLIIISVFMIFQIGPIKDWLETTVQEFAWPGLHIVTPDGTPPKSATFSFNYLPAAGTVLLICGLLTMAVLRVSPMRALRVYGATLNQMKWATLTVCSVLALAYVMNQSGQTSTLALWLAGAGSIFAFLSSIIGWLGVSVTGSDTSSNALFGALQVKAAQGAGLSPTLMAAANSSGGVLGKMISPQNLAIGAAAVGIIGREGDLFRKVVGWSLVLLLAMCVLVTLQSTAVLSWMVP